MKDYFKKLLIFSAAVSLITYLIFLFPIKSLQTFTLLGIIFFTVLSAVIYTIVSLGIKNKSSHAFVTFVYLAMMAKMVLCVLAVLGYFFLAKPEGIYFVIPFFVLYICYTVFETYYLVKESGNK